MAGVKALLESEFLADGAVTKYRIIKKGTSEDDVSQSAAATDASFGVSQETSADNGRVRVALGGISKVEFGGNVTQGQLLVPDANGKAVAATRHTHVENTAGAYTRNASTNAATAERAVGIAMVNGAAGDIGTVLIVPQFV